MSSTPYVPQAPVLGQKILDTGSGTADQTVFVAGTFGAQLASLTIYSGPGTPPGEGTVFVRLAEGSVSTTFHASPLTNAAGALQAIVPLGIELEGGAELRVALGDSLPAGAEIHCTVTGRTYEPATEEEEEE